MCPLWFPAFSALLSLPFHHCYSWQKTKSKLHTPILTVVHTEVVCAPKILPLGIFLTCSFRSTITAPWDMSQYQNSLRISLETSVLTCISKFTSLWLCSWQSDWTRPRKRLGYEVNFLPRVRPRMVRSFYPLFICFSFSSLSDWLVRTIDKGEVSLWGWDKYCTCDGKASLKRQKSPETTTDTQDASKFYWFYVKMFIFRNIYSCKSTIFRSPYYS